METRVYKGTNVRAAKGADFVIEGTAASYNVLSNDLGGFREKIAPGAFDLSLSSPDSDVRCLVNHDPSLILGRSRSGTLKVWADSTGLQFRCQLDNTNSAHQSAFASIKRGDLSECSFAFTVPDGGDSWDNATPLTRTLRRVDLMDDSAVTYPAYGQPGSTQVSARALEHARKLVPKNFPTSGTCLSYMPSDEMKDLARRHAAAVIGDLVVADMRDLTAEEVSANRIWESNLLKDALDKKGFHYLFHNAAYAFALPSNVFDSDPDMDMATAMTKARKFRYSWGVGGLNLGPMEDIADEDNCRADWNVLENLRDNSRLKIRMRGAAGIFRR